MSQPLISLILCVKNGMPYLPEALRSVEQLSYENYEVIVQDCLSDDGSLQCYDRFSHLPLKIVSEADAGIGDGYRRALERCSGEIVGSIDADNLLMPNALHEVAAAFQKDTDLAVLYSSVQMIESDGTSAHLFEPEQFNIDKLLSGDLVPPFSTSFFHRDRCGEHFIFDSAPKTCVDFDLWLRVSGLKIHCIAEVLGCTRMSQKSMSCRPEDYQQFIIDKSQSIDNFIARTGYDVDRDSCVAGLCIWAAEMLYFMQGLSDHTLSFYNRAVDLVGENNSRIKNFQRKYLI